MVRHTLLLSAALATLAASPAVSAVSAQAPTRLNFVNADLADVVRSLASVLGVNVMLTDVPPRRITFSTPQPVRSEELGGVLESILESNGLVLVRNGPVAEVMPVEKAPATGPISYGRELPSPPPLGLIT